MSSPDSTNASWDPVCMREGATMISSNASSAAMGL